MPLLRTPQAGVYTSLALAWGPSSVPGFSVPRYCAEVGIPESKGPAIQAAEVIWSRLGGAKVLAQDSGVSWDVEPESAKTEKVLDKLREVGYPTWRAEGLVQPLPPLLPTSPAAGP